MRLRSFCFLALLVPSVGCGRSLEGAACPCVEGYVCCAESRTCQPRGECGDGDAASPPDSIPLPEYTSSDGWRGALVDYSAVFGTSPEDIWVGAHHVADSAWRSTLLHFDGTTWSMAQAYAPGLQADDVTAIWAASERDVWVGDSSGFSHWDGTTWTRFPGSTGFFQQGNTSYQFNAAPVRALFGFATDDVWSVGSSLAATHWDGTAWTTLATSDDYATDLTRTFWGVWGSAPNDVWFVGDSGTISHWDGSRFARYGDDFGGGATTANLRAVCGTSSTHAWAVGAGTTVLHWDGAHWQNVGFSVPISADLNAVHCDPNGEVWIAGVDGSLARWDGGGWYEVSRAAKLPVQALWGAPGAGLWSVGDGGSVEHWNGAAWLSAPSPVTSADLLSVWSPSEDDVWTFGSDEYFYHFDGQHWSDKIYPPSPALSQPMNAAITGSAADDLWAVAGGGLFHMAGAYWSNAAQTSQAGRGLWRAVWARAGDDVWAAGSAVDSGDPSTSHNAPVLHWDGSSFTALDSGVLRNLTAIAGFAANDFWITTSSSEVLHSDGTTFRPYDLSDGAPAGTIWDRISGSASNDVWFFGRYTWSNTHTGGTGGMARRWNGTSFDPAIDLAAVLVNSIWYAGQNDAYVLRDGIHVTHLQGTAWTDENTGVSASLLSVAGNETDLWAVGSAGTMIRKHRTLTP